MQLLPIKFARVTVGATAPVVEAPPVDPDDLLPSLSARLANRRLRLRSLPSSSLAVERREGFEE